MNSTFAVEGSGGWGVLSYFSLTSCYSGSDGGGPDQQYGQGLQCGHVGHPAAPLRSVDCEARELGLSHQGGDVDPDQRAQPAPQVSSVWRDWRDAATTRTVSGQEALAVQEGGRPHTSASAGNKSSQENTEAFGQHLSSTQTTPGSRVSVSVFQVGQSVSQSVTTL